MRDAADTDMPHNLTRRFAKCGKREIQESARAAGMLTTKKWYRLG
jgi:hypothetical protein